MQWGASDSASTIIMSHGRRGAPPAPDSESTVRARAAAGVPATFTVSSWSAIDSKSTATVSSSRRGASADSTCTVSPWLASARGPGPRGTGTKVSARAVGIHCIVVGRQRLGICRVVAASRAPEPTAYSRPCSPANSATVSSAAWRPRPRPGSGWTPSRTLRAPIQTVIGRDRPGRR